MTSLEYVSRGGGVFSCLVFIHFVVDWIFQSHSEAMVKHNNGKVRAKHCAIYTVPFLPFLWWIGLTPWELVASALILFLSHFFEDTYYPVLLWAKYVRRPPSMQWRIRWIRYEESPFSKVELKGPLGVEPFYFHVLNPSTVVLDGNDWRKEIALRVACYQLDIRSAQRELDTRGFLEFIDSTLGKILMIVVDQITHLCFLWAVVWMALN